MSKRKHIFTSKTTLLKKEELPPCQWFVFDAKGKTLGRFASELAKILRGKHKVDFTSHVDSGDGVIVINASQIRVTGSKEAQKNYRYYTGHIGGMRVIPYRVMLARNPQEVIRRAVHGMMPHSRLARKQMKKLRIFKGAEHTCHAQNPIAVNA